ncbi:hypothetical protein DEO45_14245 [Rhodanobacter denitrificans]|uniref:Uncharacterized protein n=1 Tax=Rhodanobacter denitrificans TaxID=666685 RepID=A0A368KCG8_9GAMM|nr:ATP-dependent Clp protease proteolytic subunit [Rhodanobacter denitrificans]RCS28858.1 hypothetical protein DEO45_14245 [Rhodanobacter denitrificans]
MALFRIDGMQCRAGSQVSIFDTGGRVDFQAATLKRALLPLFLNAGTTGAEGHVPAKKKLRSRHGGVFRSGAGWPHGIGTHAEIAHELSITGATAASGTPYASLGHLLRPAEPASMNAGDGQTGDSAGLAAPIGPALPPSLPPRPPPLPYPPAGAPTPTQRGYIAAHWHGNLSLALSYWVNMVLVAVVARELLVWLRSLDWQHHSMVWATAVTAIAVLGCLLIAVWQYVGVWRAAERSGTGWSVVARIMVVIGCIGGCFGMFNNARILTDMVHAATVQRTWNDFSINVSPDGSAIDATGSMGFGFADRIERAFTDHAGIHMLRIASPGGSVSEGVDLHDFLHAHPDITVQADGICASACTLAFIGAAQRWATPRAWFGFHQMRSLLANTRSVDYVTTKQDDFKRELRALGASPDFIRLAFAKQGNDVYIPDSAELFGNHIITAIDANGKRWQADAWRSEQFLQALRHDPHGRTLAQTFDRIAVVQPAIYRTWVLGDLAVPSNPRSAAAARRNDNFWHALDAARAHQLEVASAQDVRRYALSHQQTLTMLRQQLSTSACGRYASGIAISLGPHAGAFKDIVGPGYLALFSGNDTVQLPSPAWRASLTDALHKHQEERWVSQGELVDEVHWSANCNRQLATLDQLLNAPGAAGDLALRAYLLAR